MHERLAMTFFRLLGIPAPRETHARLYLNDQYAGVYSMVEDIDPVFLQRNLGESDGHLYAYEYAFPWAYNDLGSAPSKYSPIPYKPEDHLTDLDPSPIAEMVLLSSSAIVWLSSLT